MSFDDGFILGLSLGGGGSVSGNLRAVIDDDAGTLKIVSFTGNENYNDCIYSLETADYSKTITTHYTSGETTITRAKTFSRKIIKKITNSNNVVILTVDVDNTGRPTAYHDAENVEIHTSEWRSKIGETPNYDAINIDAVAIGYAIAKNTASSEALEEMLKSYRNGVKDGDNGRGEVSEDFDGDTPMDIPIDPIIDEPAVTNMSDGFWMGFGDKSTGTVTEYYRVYMIPFTETKTNSYGGKSTFENHLRCDKYVNGVLKETRSFGYITGGYSGIAYYEVINPYAEYSHIRTSRVTRVYYEGTKIYYTDHEQRIKSDGSIHHDTTTTHWIFENINSDFIHMTNVSPF